MSLVDLNLSPNEEVGSFLSRSLSSSPLALLSFGPKMPDPKLSLRSKEPVDEPPLGDSALTRLEKGVEKACVPLLAYAEKAPVFLPILQRRGEGLVRESALFPKGDSGLANASKPVRLVAVLCSVCCGVDCPATENCEQLLERLLPGSGMGVIIEGVGGFLS